MKYSCLQKKCMYPNYLNGIGEFKDFKHHFELESTFKPRMQTPHKVALPIETSLKEELDQMEK